MNKHKIPIEFISNFWVSLPSGLSGKGSGFLLAERIQDVYSIDCKIPQSKDFTRSWSITPLKQSELASNAYTLALCKMIFDSFTQKRKLLIVGAYEAVFNILYTFIKKYGHMEKTNPQNIILIIESKLGQL